MTTIPSFDEAFPESYANSRRNFKSLLSSFKKSLSLTMSKDSEATGELITSNETIIKVDTPAVKLSGLGSWVTTVASSDDNSTGPPEVKRRIGALRKIQNDVTHIELEFFKEMADLEAKYFPMYDKLFQKRSQIVSGAYEPADDECTFSIGDEAEEDALKETSDKTAEAEAATGKDADAATVKGIPGFWLTIFKNVDRLAELVQKEDNPVLEHLTDIRIEMTSDPTGYQLSFHFSPNDYFTNTVLTKTYVMRYEVDPKDPFSFEGPEIAKSIGCQIDWKEGMNYSVRKVQKKQKHKQSGAIRMIFKEEQIPTFFDFFSPPQVEEGAEVEMEVQDKIINDFEIGQFIRERIVPRAVLFYTGEAVDEDDYSTEADEEEEEDDDDDDDDDEEDEDENENDEDEN